jgi:EAL domain-containing protein (putative c-di-GMP-specific phosphodiesterase class I)
VDREETIRQELQRVALPLGAFRPPGTLLFVNTSRTLLRHLLQQGLGPSRAFEGLVFEVPESDRQIQQWAELLNEFRPAGVQVGVDDWGVGQANPLRVAELKPDWVKIDLAITQKVGQDPAIDRLISLLVNWLADSRCRVVAEGIESHDQVIQLRRLGVRFGQGFGLAYPAHEFPTTVRVPAPGLRMGQIAALPIALVEAYDLCDQHLEIIDKNRTALQPQIDAAIEALAGWIHETQVAANLDAISS